MYHRGDEIEVTVDRTGLLAGAGVGHMPDDTVVVVVGAEDKVGQPVHATVVAIQKTLLGTSLLANYKV